MQTEFTHPTRRVRIEFVHPTGCAMSQQSDYGLIGLREQELREALEEELVRAIRAEGEVPTIHAIAHSVARVLELDHLRMAEQLRRAGARLEEGED
jgi:hypothetical protein